MLAALVTLAVGLAATSAATFAALAAHHLILAGSGDVVATVLARIATVATSVGHFIFKTKIFFTRVGKIQDFSKQEEVPNLQLGLLAP